MRPMSLINILVLVVKNVNRDYSTRLVVGELRVFMLVSIVYSIYNFSGSLSSQTASG